MRNKSGKIGKWIVCILLNGFEPWVPGSASNVPAYMIDELGVVHLRGAVTHDGTGAGAAQYIAKLPPAYRPSSNTYGITVVNVGSEIGGGNTAKNFFVNRLGDFKVSGVGSGSGWINLSGLFWHVGKERLRLL